MTFEQWSWTVAPIAVVAIFIGLFGGSHGFFVMCFGMAFFWLAPCIVAILIKAFLATIGFLVKVIAERP